VLTGIIGNGAAVILAAVALFMVKHRHDLPGRRTPEVLLTAAIVMMAFAGTLARETGFGHWIAGLIGWISRAIGQDANLVLAVITLFVLGMLARHILKTAATTGLWLAFVLPFLLAVFSSGFFHTLGTDLQGPAAAVSNAIQSRI